MNGTNGTSETWAPIPGYEGMYEASNKGRVRGMDRVIVRSNGSSMKIAGRTMRQQARNSYRFCQLRNAGKVRQAAVHVLVLEAFSGQRPDGLEARHLDGDPSNNRIENLAWGTHQENMLDREKHGTSNKGDRNGNSILTEDDVISIRAASTFGETDLSISKRYEVSPSTIRCVRNGRRWKHVGGPITADSRVNSVLTGDRNGNSKAARERRALSLVARHVAGLEADHE